jgi:hypothetical protein
LALRDVLRCPYEPSCYRHGGPSISALVDAKWAAGVWGQYPATRAGSACGPTSRDHHLLEVVDHPTRLALELLHTYRMPRAAHVVHRDMIRRE